MEVFSHEGSKKLIIVTVAVVKLGIKCNRVYSGIREGTKEKIIQHLSHLINTAATAGAALQDRQCLKLQIQSSK